MAKGKIMVCVTKQRTCERLIQTGARMAKEMDIEELLVVHVLGKQDAILGNLMEADALDFLYEASKQVGAEMTVLRSEKVTDTLVNFAKEQQVSVVVLGEGPRTSRNKQTIGLIARLQTQLPEVTVRVIPA